jgi:DNA-binding beta-propeller fold protein YncE
VILRRGSAGFAIHHGIRQTCIVTTAASAGSPRPTWIRAARLAGLTAIVSASAAGWWFLTRSPKLEPGWGATVGVLAGDGVPGARDGHASRARFSDPFGVAIGADGTLFVADAGEAQSIRRIAPDGVVSTLAGGTPGFADGSGAAARFDTPSGLAIALDGTLYIADSGNNAIRRITPDGHVSTLAGDGVAGYRDGAGYQARFNGPIGVAIDPAGRVIVADTYNDRIRAIDRDGTVQTLAGSGEPGLLDGFGAQSRFDTPCGVAIDGAGRIHVADTGNGVVRTIRADGLVTTLAGPVQDSPGRPLGIAASSNGDLYVTDERGRIVELSAGSARTLAGSSPGFRDGPGFDARFRQPAGIALAGPGRLVVADAGNALIRLLGAPSRLEFRPPASPRINPRFDDESFARLPLLWPVAPMDGPHEVAGTMGEARGEGAERFHSGIDVRVEEGTLVRAVREGVVAAPISTGSFGSLNEWVRIGAVTYVHVRTGRTRGSEMLDTARFVPTYDETGVLTRVRTKRGARFATGDAIATVNPFNHVHLNVGWPGDEHNPLQFRLVHFEDSVPPTIARRGVRLYGEYGEPLTERARGRVLVSGRVRIVVDAWDQADGNRPSRRLGLYALGYQVLNKDGSPAPGFETADDTIRFDRIASESEAARLIYATGSGIPFYGSRVTRFFYVVTNTLSGGIASEGFWDAARLPSGDYTLRIRATDIRGNTAVANRDLPITIVAPGRASGAH